MLVLLPPSEGKAAPTRGKPMDPSALSYPDLAPLRKNVLHSLVDLCTADPATAIDVLGLGPTQFELVVQNSALEQAPSAAASAVYSGVLYSALDFSSLKGSELRRANRRLRFVSALFGVLQPNDRIASYRLSGGTRLPGIGALPAYWREALSEQIAEAPALVVDMLSSPYSSMVALPKGAVTVKVWQDGPNGQRTPVSHFNKETKGHVARLLGTAEDEPVTGADVVDVLRAGGWRAELDGARVDVWMRK